MGKGRENKERYNVSSKSLYKLGINLYGVKGLQKIYNDYIVPCYIGETFNDGIGIPWIFSMNKAHSLSLDPIRYPLQGWDEIYRTAEKLDVINPVTKVENSFYTSVRLLELIGLVLQEFKDTGWTTEPAHFVLGEGKEAVEFFIGVKTSQESKNYDNRNVFRDL